MDNKYITVSQYAEIKGISKQAVYKQLKNKLKPFLIMVESQKCINIEALNEVEKQKLNQVEQPIEQQFNNQIQPFFQTQLEEKDKIIQSLLRQVESLQEQNGKLTDIINNNQYLMAGQQKIYIEQGKQTEEEKEEITPKKGFFSFLKRKSK